MDKLTGSGKTIIGTDPDKMWLDQAVKNILALSLEPRLYAISMNMLRRSSFASSE